MTPLMRYFQLSKEEREALDKETLAEEERERELDKQRRYEKSGIGERYFNERLKTFTIDTEERKQLVKSVYDYIKAERYRILILLGKSGTGKTHMAAACVREMGGLYRTSYMLCCEYEASKSFQNPDGNILDFIDRYASARFLVIDEIGRVEERDIEKEKHIVYQITNERYNRQRNTMYVSNFQRSEFSAYMGTAFIDRINEAGQTIELKGESYRPVLRGK